MAQLSARLDDEIDERIGKVLERYGSTKTSIVENALEAWLDRFEGAGELERLRMIIRPKGEKEDAA